MTKCNWKKFGYSLILGLLIVAMTNIAWAEDNNTASSESNTSNAAVEEDIETFFGALKLGDKKDQDVIDKFRKNCEDAEKKVKDKEKEIADINVKINQTITQGAAGSSVTGYVMITTKSINDPVAYKKYTEEKKLLQEELEQLKEEKNRICAESDEALENAEGAIYVYTGSDGSELFFQYDGRTAKALNGVTRGCVPLPMKVNEGKTCIFCPLFEKIFNAANVMSTNSYGVLANALANVMLIGFAIWIAFSLLGKVSSFTKMDAPKYITELLTQVFKVLLAYLLLRDAHAVYNYALGPLLKGGMEFGMTLLAGSDKYLDSCKSLGVESMPTSGLLPAYLYTQLECFIRAVQAELALQQAIGSSLMCVAFNAGGEIKDIKVTSFTIPNFSMLIEGILIWVFAWLLSLAFAFYLVDATVRLGIVGALMPFLIASWPFKVTSKYTSQGFTMFMNTFFTYVFMGLVVSINIQLIGSSLSGAPGGMDAIEDALNSNKVKEFQEMLDIGFAGFLILIASCIFGFKICGQTADLAGSMAGGGGGSSIAPELGGMGYNVAKSATLGTASAIGGGAKFLGEATGVNEKARKFRDKAVDKLIVSPLAKVFSFGRSEGGASKKATHSQAPKPQTSPNAGGNGGSPITPDQTRQADNVVNAAPRPTATQQNQNPRQTQSGGSQTSTASSQTNNSSSTQDNQNVLTPEQQREQRIDQFNRNHAAALDLNKNSAEYRQLSEQSGKATTNRDAAAQRARSFEAQAKEEMDKAKSLREKAQQMADSAEKDALIQQANSSDKNANDFTAKAAEEKNKEKENDAIVRETLQKMEDMKQERLKTMSNEDIDGIMKQSYGNDYRADQSANRNGWSF